MKVDRCPKCKTDLAVIIVNILHEFPHYDYWDEDAKDWHASEYREIVRCKCLVCKTVWSDTRTGDQMVADIKKTNSLVKSMFLEKTERRSNG